MASKHVWGEAADWIARLMSGFASADDHCAFALWRMQSAENEVAGSQALKLWGLAGSALRRGSGVGYAPLSRYVGAGRGDDRQPEDCALLPQHSGRLNAWASTYL